VRQTRGWDGSFHGKHGLDLLHFRRQILKKHLNRRRRAKTLVQPKHIGQLSDPVIIVKRHSVIVYL
jgi:hypothetical protein